jgi:hypothetical protein
MMRAWKLSMRLDRENSGSMTSEMLTISDDSKIPAIVADRMGSTL